MTDTPVFNKVTPLYMEMEICAEFIGCWHWEFEEQGLEEKLKWYYFREMKIERESNRVEKDKEKLDRKQLEMKDRTDSRSPKGRLPKTTGSRRK